MWFTPPTSPLISTGSRRHTTRRRSAGATRSTPRSAPRATASLASPTATWCAAATPLCLRVVAPSVVSSPLHAGIRQETRRQSRAWYTAPKGRSNCWTCVVAFPKPRMELRFGRKRVLHGFCQSWPGRRFGPPSSQAPAPALTSALDPVLRLGGLSRPLHGPMCMARWAPSRGGANLSPGYRSAATGFTPVHRRVSVAWAVTCYVPIALARSHRSEAILSAEGHTW